MTALLSEIARPTTNKAPRIAFRLFKACHAGIARYFVQRAAIARLREFDDAELRDIGLTWSEIEPAVRGRDTSLPDWPRR